MCNRFWTAFLVTYFPLHKLRLVLSIDWRRGLGILFGQEVGLLIRLPTSSCLICYGGLGINSFGQKNTAILTKWLWRFSKEEASLWGRLIVAIYGLKENAWSTKDPNRGRSYRLWAGILKHKETFKLLAFLLGEGTIIRFWKDGWCDVQPLAEKFPNLFSWSLNKDAFVAECWCNVSHSWNSGLRRNVLDNEPDNVATILKILHSWAPSDGGDSLKWIPNVNGNFTTKSTFLLMVTHL